MRGCMPHFVALLLVAAVASTASAQCLWDDGGLTEVTSPPVGTNWTIVTDTLLNPSPEGVFAFDRVTVSAGTRLVFNNVAFTFQANLVTVDGELHVGEPGSGSCLITENIVIELVGDSNDGATKGIYVTEAGLLSVGSSFPATTYTRLAATAVRDSTSLTLDTSPVGWQAGDEVVITSTDFFSDQTQVATIDSISGADLETTLGIDFQFWGEAPEAAEVLNLDGRAVTIRGDSASAGGFEGGFIHVASANAVIDGARIERMGVRSVDRFAIHFENPDPAGGGELAVRNCLGKDNYHSFVTLTNATGVTVDSNAAYNTYGHVFATTNGAEFGNTFSNNIGAVALPILSLGSEHESAPAIFFLTHPNNVVENNVAVGGDFGFLYALPSRPVKSSDGVAADGDYDYRPREAPLGSFQGNLAHSVDRDGLALAGWYCLDNLGSAFENCAYEPKEAGNPSAALDVFVVDFTAYKCKGSGADLGGIGVYLVDSVLHDNRVGVSMSTFDDDPTQSSVSGVTDCDIVGESANPGNRFAMYLTFPLPNTDPGPRSRPLSDYCEARIAGVVHSGHGGTVVVTGTTLSAFAYTELPNGEVRGAGAFGFAENVLAFQDRGTVATSARALVARGCTLTDAEPVFFSPPWAGVSPTGDGTSNYVLEDADGSLTGVAGSTLVTRNYPVALLPGTGCEYVAVWGATHCVPSTSRVGTVFIANLDVPGSDFGDSVGLDFDVRATVYPFGANLGDDVSGGALNLTGAPADEGTRSRYTFNTPLGYPGSTAGGVAVVFPHPSLELLALAAVGVAPGEGLTVALAYPTDTTFTVLGAMGIMAAGSDLSELDEATYFFDAATGWLYLRLFNLERVSDPAGTAGVGLDSSLAPVLVEATCSANCALPAQPEIPAAVAPGNLPLFYAADLEGCQAGVVTSATGSASFEFDEQSGMLTYAVAHSLGGAATGARIVNTGDDSTVWTLPAVPSPIRGVIFAGLEAANALREGMYAVVVDTTANPTGELRGQIGCDGPPSCDAFPIAYTTPAPCEAAVTEVGILAAGAATTWTIDSPNATVTVDTSEALCSDDVLKVVTSPFGGVSFAAPGGVVEIDTAAVGYLQFWIKGDAVENAGVLTPPIGATVGQADDVLGGPPQPVVVVHRRMVNSRVVVADTWNRVLVPVAALGLPAAAAVNITSVSVLLAPPDTLDAESYQTTFYVADVRFISTEEAAPVASPAPGTATYDLVSPICECELDSDCDDGNNCTDDTCVAFGCDFAPNSDPCDNGVFCDGADTCSGGSCSLSAGDPCAGGAACNNVCDEGGASCLAPEDTPCPSPANNTCSYGLCSAAGSCEVLYLEEGDACSDGDSCTTLDRCVVDGDETTVCAGVEACDCTYDADCDSDNPCLEATCQANGTCAFAFKTGPCDDGVFCNGEDTCTNGFCESHAGNPCDGGDECQDQCDEERGACLSPAGTSCGAGAGECTLNICDGVDGNCLEINYPAGTICGEDDRGACLAGGTCELAAVNCTDDANCTTANPCLEAGVCSAGTCTFANITGTPCDRGGDFCAGEGLCLEGVCVANSGFEPCPALDDGCPNFCNEALDVCSNTTCPNDCSGAGLCCESLCVCNRGWLPGPGLDCSDGPTPLVAFTDRVVLVTMASRSERFFAITLNPDDLGEGEMVFRVLLTASTTEAGRVPPAMYASVESVPGTTPGTYVFGWTERDTSNPDDLARELEIVASASATVYVVLASGPTAVTFNLTLSQASAPLSLAPETREPEGEFELLGQGLAFWLIIAGAILLLGILLIGCCCWCVHRRHKNKNKKSKNLTVGRFSGSDSEYTDIFDESVFQAHHFMPVAGETGSKNRFGIDQKAFLNTSSSVSDAGHNKAAVAAVEAGAAGAVSGGGGDKPKVRTRKRVVKAGSSDSTTSSTSSTSSSSAKAAPPKPKVAAQPKRRVRKRVVVNEKGNATTSSSS